MRVVVVDDERPAREELIYLLSQLENIEVVGEAATAYDQYALKAFDVNAMDYLLKPFKEERLKETIQRLQKRFKEKKSPGHPEGSAQNAEFLQKIDQIYSMLKPGRESGKLKVEENGRIYLIPPQEIIYATIEERSVRVFAEKGSYLTQYTLSELENLLGEPFLRVHKSFLANLNKIISITPWFNSTYNLLMEGGTEVPVSRTYVKVFRERLDL